MFRPSRVILREVVMKGRIVMAINITDVQNINLKYMYCRFIFCTSVI